jgi:hypothetical protein
MSKRRYFAWLLRIWESGEDEANWQASLQDPHSGERIGFASPEGMWLYVRKHMATAQEQNRADQKEDAT